MSVLGCDYPFDMGCDAPAAAVRELGLPPATERAIARRHAGAAARRRIAARYELRAPGRRAPRSLSTLNRSIVDVLTASPFAAFRVNFARRTFETSPIEQIW